MRFMYMSWPIIGPNALTCQKSHWIASDLSAASAVGSKDEGCFSQRYSMMAPLSNTATGLLGVAKSTRVGVRPLGFSLTYSGAFC